MLVPHRYPLFPSVNSANKCATALILLAELFAANALAENNTVPKAVEQIQRSISALNQNSNTEMGQARITPSAIPSLYTVVMGTDIGYMTADGRYLVRGEIIDLHTKVNLTELDTKKIVSEIVKSLDHADLITFAPDKPKFNVVVFTDIDCSYCRKLHGHIADYNKLGIGIHYAAFPRAGRDSESFTKAVSVWCSDNRASAITRAKAGAVPEPKTCTNPVSAHLDIAEKLHFEGTPTMVLADGSVIPGYLEPEELVGRLQLLTDSVTEGK